MAALQEELLRRINEDPRGWISFRDYMELALYHPTDGYYMRPQTKIGKRGDYYTSSSIHPVFAQTIARLVIKVGKMWGRIPPFCEGGGGTGEFARQFLDDLQAVDPQGYASIRYLMMEKSGYHRQMQKEKLAAHAGRLTWLGEGEEREVPFPSSGILFANEFFDAFPVHVVEKGPEGWLEVGAGYDGIRRRFVEKKVPLQNEDVQAYLKEIPCSLPTGHRVEVPIDAVRWVREKALRMKEGLWLVIDYGYRWEDLCAGDYRRGTVRSFFNHQVDGDVYDRPGLMDITAHVCFDALSQAAQNGGFEEVGLIPQDKFLLMAGLLDLLENHNERDPFHPKAKKNRAIAHLLSPAGISASFSVLVLAKGVPEKVQDLFRTPLDKIFNYGRRM